jgi:hypothetical protein
LKEAKKTRNLRLDALKEEESTPSPLARNSKLVMAPTGTPESNEKSISDFSIPEDDLDAILGEYLSPREFVSSPRKEQSSESGEVC